jgi:hypothetical protein
VRPFIDPLVIFLCDMFRGRVEAIYVAPAAAEPVVELPAVRAVRGRGLEGDRYFLLTSPFVIPIVCSSFLKD